MLDAFYDIFAESCYNKALVEYDVLALMQGGNAALQTRYTTARNEKTLSHGELNNVENALLSLPEFVKYKQKEMNL